MQKALGVVGIIVAATVLSVMAAPAMVNAAAPLLKVFVANDDANPVPTKAKGTTAVEGAVSVTNFPAAQPPALWQGTPYAKSKLLINVEFDQCADPFEIPAGKVLYVERAVASFNIPPGASGYAEVRLTPVGGTGVTRIDVPSHRDGPVSQVGGNNDSYSGTLELGIPVTSISGCFVSSGGLVGKTSVIGYLVPA